MNLRKGNTYRTTTFRRTRSDSTTAANAKISDDYCSWDSRTEPASCTSLESIEIGSSLSIRGTKALFESFFQQRRYLRVAAADTLDCAQLLYIESIPGQFPAQVLRKSAEILFTAARRRERVLNTFSKRTAREERQLLRESCKNLLTRFCKEFWTIPLNFLSRWM